MANAKLDENSIPTLTGVSSVDLATPIRVAVNPTTNALLVDATVVATVDTTGLATDSNQTDGSQKTQIVDGSGNVIGATSNALDVNIKSGSSSGTQYTEGDTDASITGTAMMFETNTGTNALGVVNASNPLPVSVTGGGDATAANQTTIIGYVDGIEALLTTIDADTSKIPSQGQALAAASMPVVLPADQITTLTPPAAITGFATSAKQDTIIGHVDGIETLLGTIDTDTSNLNDTTQVEDEAYTAGHRIVMSGGVRRDADTSPVSTTGDVHPFVFEETGRLKVATYPGSVSTYTDNITSNGDTVTLDVSRYSNLVIHCLGTFSTINCTFEGSINGGTNWFTVQAVRTNANTVEATTGNLSAAPAYAWELSVNALTHFRVRATAFTSGTQSWVFAPGTYATEPIPAIQTTGTQPVSLAAAATSIGKAEDAAHASGDVGVPALAVRNDSNATSFSGANGDYTPISVDAQGNPQIDVLTMPTVTVDLGVNNDVVVSGTLTGITDVVHIDDNAGSLTVDGTVTANLSATDNAVLDNIVSNQTDGTQKTQIVDSGGEAVTVTGGKLDVNASIDTTGLATSSGQTTIIGHVDGIETLLGTIDADTSNLSTKIDTIAGAVSGTEMQVDVLTLPSITGTVTANAGTNLNTSALALEAGGNLAAIKAKTDNIPALGQALASASVPVILPAATITTLTPPAAITGFATSAKQDTIIGHVDGIETVLGTIDADTSNISTKIDTIAGAISATHMQVDVLTAPTTAVTGPLTDTQLRASAVPVSLASVPSHAVTNAGTFATQVTAISAGDNNIGNVDIASIAAGNNNIGDVDVASIAAGDNNIGNVDLASAIPAGTNAIGKLLPPDIDVTAHTNYARKYYTSAGAATDGIIWSPAAGKRWHVVTMYIQVSADATVTLEDDKAAGDDPVWKGEIAAKSGVVLSFTEKYPMASGEDAADLLVTTSAGNVYITCVGYEI
jgi:hypothetical protein